MKTAILFVAMVALRLKPTRSYIPIASERRLRVGCGLSRPGKIFCDGNILCWFDRPESAKRDMAAAKRFFDKAMGANGDPNKVAMDKSGANEATIDEVNAGRDVPMVVHQVKYLNNIVEQDHRAIKQMTRPMLNSKTFQSASSVLAEIELIHMIHKG
jgi:hypothetical protein